MACAVENYGEACVAMAAYSVASILLMRVGISASIRTLFTVASLVFIVITFAPGSVLVMVVYLAGIVHGYFEHFFSSFPVRARRTGTCHKKDSVPDCPVGAPDAAHPDELPDVPTTPLRLDEKCATPERAYTPEPEVVPITTDIAPYDVNDPDQMDDAPDDDVPTPDENPCTDCGRCDE